VTVVFAISGHGFGHASRVIEVINALLARRPQVRVEVRTSAPRWLFDLTVRGPFGFSEVAGDVGVVQVDSLRLDIPATLGRAAEFYGDFTERSRVEARALAALGTRLVVADVPPLALAAAARVGVPAVGLTNFTWEWIYEGYIGGDRQLAWIPETIREAHAGAEEAWRLPLGGGFGGFRRVADLPFVARHSHRTAEEVRRGLRLPTDRPVVLVSFGGFGLEGLPLAQVAAAGRFALVTTDTPHPGAAPAHHRPDVVQPTAAGLFVVDERALYAHGWRYEDLVAAADVVVTKPGYGIVSECVANRTAVLYTARGEFAEYDALVAGMPRHLRCAFIDHGDLLGGRWLPHLEDVLAQPPPPEYPATNGAEIAAERIVARLG